MSTFLIAGPLIVFLIFVAPLWLFLHYRSKKKSGKIDNFSKLIPRLVRKFSVEQAESMQDRVKNPGKNTGCGVAKLETKRRVENCIAIP